MAQRHALKESRHMPVQPVVQKSIVDRENQTVSCTVFLPVSPRMAWELVGTSDGLAKWLPPFGVELHEWKVGGTGYFYHTKGNVSEVEITEYDPPRSVTYKQGTLMIRPIAPGNHLVITHSVKEVPGGSEVTVFSTGFADLPQEEPGQESRLDHYQEGWPRELRELAAFVEGHGFGVYADKK